MGGGGTEGGERERERDKVFTLPVIIGSGRAGVAEHVLKSTNQ